MEYYIKLKNGLDLNSHSLNYDAKYNPKLILYLHFHFPLIYGITKAERFYIV